MHSPGYGLLIRYNFGNKIINIFEFKTKMRRYGSQNNDKARDMNSRMMLFAPRSAGPFLEQRLVTLIIKIEKMLVRRKLVREYAQMRLKYIFKLTHMSIKDTYKLYNILSKIN